MNESDRLHATLHSRLPAFSGRVARAEAVIAEALQVMTTPYVAFSGGVDSTVMLDLVLRQRPECPVIWGDNGWDYPETLVFLAETEARYGFRLIRMRTVESFQDFAREMGRPDLAEHPNAPGAWDNPRVWDGEWWLKDTSFDGYDGVFLGMLGKRRKDGGESTRRFWALRGGAHALYHSAADGGTWHCCPLASWTKRDVWAYVVSRGLAYNPVYDRLAALGVPLEAQRCAELTAYQTAQYGAYVTLRRGWPDLYNRFTAIFPQVRTMA